MVWNDPCFHYEVEPNQCNWGEFPVKRGGGDFLFTGENCMVDTCLLDCLPQPINNYEYKGWMLIKNLQIHVFLLVSKQKETPCLDQNRGNTSPPTCSHFGTHALSTRFPHRFPSLSTCPQAWETHMEEVDGETGGTLELFWPTEVREMWHATWIKIPSQSYLHAQLTVNITPSCNHWVCRSMPLFSEGLCIVYTKYVFKKGMRHLRNEGRFFKK